MTKITRTVDFDDSGLEGIVEKYSWTYPDKFIYLAIVENGKMPTFVYEHVLTPDNKNAFKKYDVESKEKAKELYDSIRKMYDLEFDKYYYQPEHYGIIGQ